MSVPSTVIRNISAAAEQIRRGRLVAFPTETVYGLGADAGNSDAVAGIFEAKQRPTFDPLIVHVLNLAAAAELVTDFPSPARRLAEHFWPGPLTLVLPKRDVISDLVTAGLSAVGLRVPNHPIALQLLKEAGCPIAAPSANPFGGISPTTAQHVIDGLGGLVHAVLDGGACSVGVESTIVSFTEREPMLLRHGGLPVEDIEAVIGPVHIARSNPSGDDAAQPAPGMLSRHYAPKTRLLLLTATETAIPPEDLRSGLLTYGQKRFTDGFTQVESLAASTDLRICAARLFAALRSLDAADLDVIIAHRFPEYGLGMALNDRLERASFNDQLPINRTANS